MNGDEWTAFRCLSERITAEALVGFLGAEGVPARVTAPQLLPGLEGYFIVEVPRSLLHRARWVAPESAFTTAELGFMATGKLGAGHE